MLEVNGRFVMQAEAGEEQPRTELEVSCSHRLGGQSLSATNRMSSHGAAEMTLSTPCRWQLPGWAGPMVCRARLAGDRAPTHLPSTLTKSPACPYQEACWSSFKAPIPFLWRRLWNCLSVLLD